MRRYKVGMSDRTPLPKGVKLAEWLQVPPHVQSESSRQAAKAAAIEKRERRAAKWRERRVA